MTPSKAYATFALILLAGCAALGIAPADTFNKKAVVAYAAVGAAYDLAADLNEAGKLTPEKKADVLKSLDDVVAAIDAAVAVSATDPTQAEKRLTAALLVLNVIDAYLRSQA